MPSEIDHDEIQLFVLIYAPDLKQLPAIPDPTNSSYSVPSSQPRGRDNERPLDAHSTSNPSVSPSNGFDTPRTTPGFSPPGTSASGGQSAAFSALYARAVGLVERPSMVLPFSTPAGWIYQLRHVEPSLLYLQQSFAGENGGQVSQVVSWVGQTVVVLGGEEGDGGLADDDDDDAQGDAGGAGKDRWWIGSDLIGLGKGVDIVDVTRLGEDWHRRAEAK